MIDNSAPPRFAPPRRVVLAAGGTAGHIVPALAVAEAYRAAAPDGQIIFIGTPVGLERHMVPPHGYRLELIPGTPLFGTGWSGRSKALHQLTMGFVRARRLLRREQIDLAIGFGGYTSAGALLAARSLGLRTAIHESNSAPGLANRLLGRWVDRVYLGFEAARPAFPAHKCRTVGIPVSRRFARLGAARQAPHGQNRPIHLLVTGGTLGSAFFNRVAPELAKQLIDRGVALEVLHQAGNVAGVDWATRDARFSPPDLQSVRDAYAARGVAAGVVPFIDDMTEAYGWADIALCCAGSTLAELAAAALPAMAVPLASASEDHQRANVQAFAEQTGLWWCTEAQWDSVQVAARLATLCNDAQAWEMIADGLRRSAVNAAAADLVADCEAMFAIA
jgi:UDP-N-acetylglucosamine--N-acetylmuramyl-(pentapeptide) pyrophosphoryl-undecaprenol N-acetylglucosamine transferase